MRESITRAANVRVGISVRRELAEEADTLAGEMGVSRSGLYSMAVREFIRRRASERLLEKLNEVYAEPDADEEAVVEGIKRHSRRVLDEDER